MRMKNIIVCNQKGGVGKSLIADELAFSFEKDNITTDFYNLDPQGGTIHKVHEEERAQVGIIDTPGALSEEMDTWLKAADLAIVPTRPTARDVETLLRMRDILKKKKLPVIYIINGINRWRASRDFKDWIYKEFEGERILQIPQSEVFVQAVLAEKSVVETAPDSPAAYAIRLLYQEVKKIIGIKNAND